MVQSRSVVFADDLTGAAETAARFGTGTIVELWPARPGGAAARCGTPGDDAVATGPARSAAPGPVRVVDLDTRSLPPTCAAERTTRIVMGPSGRTRSPLLIKMDSLLRGPTVAVLARLVHRWPVVMCPALPEKGRTVVDSTLLVDGTPLSATRLWEWEPAPAPRTLADWLAGVPWRPVGLAEVRRGDLRARRGSVSVCDAETDDDLQTIAASVADGAGIALVGSSALLAHAVPVRTTAVPLPADRRPRRQVAVVGTAAPGVDAQIRAVDPTRTEVVRVSVGVLRSPRRWDVVDRIVTALPHRPVLLAWDEDDGDAGDGTDALARLVRDVDGPGADLFLTGGRTARSVLDALNIDRLHVLGEPESGAVISLAADGRLVCTRPGSFGDQDSIERCSDALARRRLTFTTTGELRP